MKKTIASVLISILLFSSSSVNATKDALGTWRIDTRGSRDPLVQVDLPDLRGKRRAVFVAFEYARRCDPIFLYAEIDGNRLGTPKSQAVLKDSKIGIILNGKFHTWHAAQTIYDNGFEAGFGVPNELVLQLLIDIESLAYVTPSGERIFLPTANFQQGFQAAIEFCRRRVK